MAIRVALAMGGGTSQGTFSGSALTEALKLLLIYQKEDVEIDVVSGASAGSVSLVLLLRSLLRKLSSAENEAASARLRALHGSALRGLSAKRMRQLVAVQHAQDEQEELWARQAHIGELIRRKGSEVPIAADPNTRTEPGVIDRSLVDDLARKYLVDVSNAAFKPRRVVGKRVLCCFTLANLSPLTYRARGDLSPTGEDSSSLAGLADALTSSGHRETRVFDLNFEELTPPLEPGSHPPMWYRLHLGADGAKGPLHDLRKREAWATLSASAIASSAFPLGFAPVSLRRFRWEYPTDLWPLPKEKEHVYTYVDGGTFNNEPLREAFRLAAFLDGLRRDDAQRIVLFVDPNLSSIKDFDPRVPILRRFGASGDQRTTLSRLLSQAGTLIQALRNESSVNEADRSFNTLSLFDVRTRQRAILRNALDPAPGPLTGAKATALRELLAELARVLEKRRHESTLPPSLLTVPMELERVIDEESTSPNIEKLANRAEKLVKEKKPEKDASAGFWLLVAQFALLDAALGLEGKRRAALVPIAPLTDPKDASSVFDLPNEAVGTFAGFMSETAQCFTLNVGRWCAFQALRCAGFVPKQARSPKQPLWTKQCETAFEREVLSRRSVILDRVKQIIEQAISGVPFVDTIAARVVAGKLSGFIAQGLEQRDVARQSFELRIIVDTKIKDIVLHALDGGKDRFESVVDVEGKRLLATVAEYETPRRRGAKGHWRAKGGRFELSRRFGSDTIFQIDLPTAAVVAKTAAFVNPVLTIDLRWRQPTGEPSIVRDWRAEDDVTALDSRLLEEPNPSLSPLEFTCGKDCEKLP